MPDETSANTETKTSEERRASVMENRLRVQGLGRGSPATRQAAGTEPRT